ncbi:MAG: serine/threonine-protein phosphatase [Acidobacteria bacterium]|nr:serine/threonine-protein phosphatase [Acidobacteriota bacterium]
MSSAAVTHTGLRREGNEDAFRERPDLGLYIVADGMGGHEAGEVASGISAEVIEAFISDTRDADLNQTWPFPFEAARSLAANRLIASIRLANRKVASAIAGNVALKGMATTVAALLLSDDDKAHIAHVGDSRVYQWREGHLRQLTHDHSWVGEQVRAGVLTNEDAQHHPWRNVVTRAISGGDDPEVEITEVVVEPGDRLLVCSDGLSSVVPHKDIEAIVAGGPQDLKQTADALVAAANAAGGPDNITVVLVEIGGSGDVA